MVAFAFIGILVAAVMVLGTPLVAFALMLETCRERTRATDTPAGGVRASHGHGAHGFEAVTA